MVRSGSRPDIRRDTAPRLDLVQQTRLRASLRIAFRPDAADAIAGRSTVGAPVDEALSTVAGAARTRLFVDRWRERVGRGPARDRDRPFQDAGSTPATAALALMFHLGLRVDGTRLATILRRTPEDLGVDLFTARRAIDPTCPRPCRRFVSAIGRYRDPSLFHEDRLELLGHATGCDACRRSMEFVRALDDELVAEIDRIEGALSPMPRVTHLAGRMGRVAFVGTGVAVLLVAIVGIVVALDRATNRGATPAPIGAGVAPDQHGWIVSASSGGGVSAYNLATSESVVLHQSSGTGPTVAEVSPDAQTLAIWTYAGEPSGRGGGSIEFMTMNGSPISNYWMGGTEFSQSIWGWLDSRSVLVITNPPNPVTPGPVPANEWAAQARLQSHLIAVDSRTGATRVLLTGDIGGAMPSPNGKFVAVLSTGDSTKVGQTLTLYPVTDGGLGPPLATVADRVRSQPVWAPDSSVLVFSRVTDAEMQRLAAGRRGEGLSEIAYVTVELVGVDDNGSVRTVETDQSFTDAYPMAAGAGASSLFYISPSSPQSPPDQLWLRTPATGRVQFLPEQGAGVVAPSIWSPMGDVFLTAIYGNSFLAPKDSAEFGNGGGAITLISVDAFGTVRALATTFSSSISVPVAWLSDSAIDPVTYANSTPLGGSVKVLGPNADLDVGDSIVAIGAADARRSFLTLYESNLGVPMVWNVESGSARRLGSGLEQLRWTGTGEDLIGVADAVPNSGIGSRIAVISNSANTYLSGSPPSWSTYDPADLGGDFTRRYSFPSLSPDGNHLSLFVLNRDARVAELWVAGWDRPAEPVARWKLPVDALIDLEATSAWIDRSTLIYAEPADWHDGLPTSARLMRVVVNQGADPVIDQLTSIRTTGNERGITLREIVVSPDHGEIAWRLRHFKESAANRGRVDSLEIVSIDDAHSHVEVARANPGDGLTWSPDGRWLAGGLAMQIVLVDVDALTFRYITSEEIASSLPVWVGTNEIWFNGNTGSGQRIWRARMN